MPSPILPGNLRDPTGVDRIERGAMRQFEKRIKRAARKYAELIDRIPGSPIVNKKYEYRLDGLILKAVLTAGEAAIDDELLEGGEDNLWFFEHYVQKSYRRGTAQEFANLSNQSRAYKAGQESVARILRSEPYRRRVALIRAREFEEMRGLAGDMKADMSRVLTDGVGRGLNPREIARNLNETAGLEIPRANRIARTEVSTALRRARWDEADDAEEQYGLRTMEMHISALSSTTRQSHAARHAKMYTREEVRDWYSRDANSINCKCSQTAVMVDEDGEPVVPQIIGRAKKMLEKSKVA